MPTESTSSAATIEQVAAAAGVSRSTVSRVVNGSSAVSPEALAAVEAAIARLSYVPNRAARSLASRQTYAIALVIPEDTTRFFGDSFFAAVVSGINARLMSTDYVLTLFIASDDPNGKATRFLRHGNVDGAMILSHHESDTFIQRIADSVPVVYGGRPVVSTESDYFVDIDNRGGARIATQHLWDRGCRSIATITGPLSMPAAVDRLEGYRDVVGAAGLPVMFEEGDFLYESGRAAMSRLRDRHPEIDGVVIANDVMARGALSTLAAEGVAVPDDIAIIGFDDAPVATSSVPHLTTIRQPSFQQGEAMAELMMQILAGKDPERAVIFDPELVIRATA